MTKETGRGFLKHAVPTAEAEPGLVATAMEPPAMTHMSASETQVQILAALLKDESMGNSSIPKHWSLRSDLAMGTTFLGLS